MGDTGSYDENIEVQETNFSSGGGGDNVSVSSRSSNSSHHHYISHHHSRGGRHYSRNSSPQGSWTAFFIAMTIVGITLIGIWIYYGAQNRSSYSSSSSRELNNAPPPPPKVWSGDFSGRYQKRSDGDWAKDSASYRYMLKEVSTLDGLIIISKEDRPGNEGNSSSSSAANSTLYKVRKSLDRGAELSFNFTSGVRFTQNSTRKGKKLIKLDYNEPDYYFEEIPTTISVEQWAEGGKKGVWREVQHSSPEVKIKRIFFDDEMTAIYQCEAEHYTNRWDIYVIRYDRRSPYG